MIRQINGYAYEVSPQDIAMDALRAAIPFLSSTARVSANGMTMSCHLTGDDRQITQKLLYVWSIIEDQKLPLSVHVEPHGFLENRHILIVLFDAKRAELPCY